jgi:hypothetical protein
MHEHTWMSRYVMRPQSRSNMRAGTCGDGLAELTAGAAHPTVDMVVDTQYIAATYSRMLDAWPRYSVGRRPPYCSLYRSIQLREQADNYKNLLPVYKHLAQNGTTHVAVLGSHSTAATEGCRCSAVCMCLSRWCAGGQQLPHATTRMLPMRTTEVNYPAVMVTSLYSCS